MLLSIVRPPDKDSDFQRRQPPDRYRRLPLYGQEPQGNALQNSEQTMLRLRPLILRRSDERAEAPRHNPSA